MTMAPLKPVLAAPEPAPEALGWLTVGVIIAGAVLAKNMAGNLIGDSRKVAGPDQVKEVDELNNTETRQVTVRGEIIDTPIVIRTPRAPSCEAQCAADRNFCMNDGKLLPKQCVQIYQACLARCP